MGVWLPDGWMESAPTGFPLPPLIPPDPPSLPAAGREGGKRLGFEGGGFAAAPNPLLFSPSLRRAVAAERGPGGGVSPESQVTRMPVDVRVHSLSCMHPNLSPRLTRQYAYAIMRSMLITKGREDMAWQSVHENPAE
jgi:hypothetical protein